MALGIKFRPVCLQRHTLRHLSHLSRFKHAYRDDPLLESHRAPPPRIKESTL